MMPMFDRTVHLLNESGLHARPATLFVETASKFRSQIMVKKGDQEVDGKSVLSLMLLELTKGTPVTIKAEGEDEVQAVNALVELMEGLFDS